MHDRLSRLTEKAAVLRVGGITETEVKEKRDRVEDVLNAAKAAVQEGVVAGDGIALLQASKLLKVDGFNANQQLGVGIVKQSLCSPIKQIIINAGLDSVLILSKIYNENNPLYGCNIQTM